MATVQASTDRPTRNMPTSQNGKASAYDELLARLRTVRDLSGAASVLMWDQMTYMPPGGASARGQQLGTLQRLSHELFTEERMGALLGELEASSAFGDDDGLVRLVRRQYDRAVRVPSSFAAEISAHTTESYEAWTQARPSNDFAAVQPHLEKTLDLSRQYASYFDAAHPADPMIDQADYGMSVATIRPIFAALREQLVPLVQAIGERPQVDDSFLHRHYPEPQQWAFGEHVIKQLGYDFQRGRQDKTHHPFAIRFSAGDVRITTRFQEADLGDGLFSTMHESGHAMYEQGVNADYEGTPLARGTSSGVHESQSRTWENIVGRSRQFWQHFYPQLRETFSAQLGDVELEDFYRAINKAQPSLIRVDADEVTYNLHVIVRFELELALLEGKLSVAELPEAWHARYREYLGVVAPDDRNGVLQDVHWYGGLIGGAFQGYTLGNIMASQFYNAALAAHPEIPQQIAQGQFETLHGWLRSNIYHHGSRFTTSELLERVTGEGLTLEPYMRYLRGKYGEIYGLESERG